MAELEQLLDLIEPPAYVYDLDELRKAYRLLRSALPEPSQILYSLKANPHPWIVATLAELGCGAEICSSGELTAALEAGVAPERMFYTGPGKRDAEVAEAFKCGVRWFSVDSPAGLRQVEEVARQHGDTAHCVLRINDRTPVPGQGLAMTGASSQFGADADWVTAEPDAFRPAATGQATGAVAGFHVYQGTNLDSEDHLAAQFGAAIASCRRLADALHLQPRVLDLGGGFGAPFARSGQLPRFSSLAARVAELLHRDFPGWERGAPAVLFESGRYLAGSCGQLVTRVADVKDSHGKPVVVLESGINHLGGMSGLRRIPQIVPDLIRSGPAGSELVPQTLVAGPLCTPLDLWARSAEVPPLHRGDIVRVPNVGAYGLSASLLAFLGHPAPREVVIDGGDIVDVSQLHVVRRRPAR
jgi:diaminopimelate decarboxylase